MLRYTVYRLLWLVPTLLAMALVTFLVMHATPGSPLDPVAEGANPLSPAHRAEQSRRLLRARQAPLGTILDLPHEGRPRRLWSVLRVQDPHRQRDHEGNLPDLTLPRNDGPGYCGRWWGDSGDPRCRVS